MVIDFKIVIIPIDDLDGPLTVSKKQTIDEIVNELRLLLDKHIELGYAVQGYGPQIIDERTSHH